MNKLLKLYKNSKKKSLYGMKAKRKLNILLMAAALCIGIGALCFTADNSFGEAVGAMMATAPVVAFTMPEGVEFSEKEAKGLQALAAHLTNQFKELSKDNLTEKEMVEKMNVALKEWADKNGIDGEKLKQLEKSLEEQGKKLTAISEKAAPKANLTGLKGLFVENYEELKKAVKEGKQNFVVKANPDTIDTTLIESTTGATSTTTGAVLTERNAFDPQLYMRRRDRQFIRDIAEVNTVAEVLETMTFDDEGSEDGTLAIVAENGLKPQVKLSIIRNKVEKQKAAAFIVVTEELIKYRTRLWAAIQRLFNDKIRRDYENQLTTSLLANVTQYISTAMDESVTNPTYFDAIMAAMNQLEQLNFIPDTLVVNPADKWKMLTTKANNGTYILPYVAQGGEFKILALNVISSNKVDSGNFLLGESGTWKVEEELPRLRTGLVNDDHIHNRMTIVGELFFMSYVPSSNAGSWIQGNFADIQEAIAVPTSEAAAA
jgi:putative sterol carrier protein